MQKVCNHHRDQLIAKRIGWTHAPSGTKRHELIGTKGRNCVHVVMSIVHEPVYIERVWVFIHAWVTLNGKDVEYKLCVRGDLETQHLASLS